MLFWATLFLFLLSLDVQQGKIEGFILFFFFLHLLLRDACFAKTLSPTHPHDEKPGEPRPASHAH